MCDARTAIGSAVKREIRLVPALHRAALESGTVIMCRSSARRLRGHETSARRNTMDVRLLMIVLRLIHILSGIFWLGAILVMTGFLLPAVRASGGEGARFMSHVMQQRRLQTYVLVAMVLTILAGLAMFGVL